MKIFDMNRPVRVHFIGIGGISMSGIALLLLDAGFQVSGSDSKESDLTKELREKGATVMIGQKRENILPDTQLAIYTAAIHPDNPEYDECVKREIPMLTRAQALGEIMANYKSAVGIAGTHGKTTTTSMVSTILMEADTDPTLFVGGVLNSINGNLRIGGRDILVTESCEYTNSFLSFRPTKEIILNIEEDHLDFFKDIDDIRRSFRRFAELLPAKENGGLLVINKTIDRLEELTAGLACEIITFGPEGSGADYTPANINYDQNAFASFDVMANDRCLGRVRLAVPGEHNVTNALSAIAMCIAMGVDTSNALESVGHFTGTERRFEKKGVREGVLIFDDYAHHPDEIEATIKAARKTNPRKLWVVFQPHTYTRTKALYDRFIRALSGADELVLADIYAARETDTLGVSSEQLAKDITAAGTPAHYFSSFSEIEKFLIKNCVHDDLLITMGAGNVVDIANDLTK